MIEYVICGKKLLNKIVEALKNNAKMSRFYYEITREPPEGLIAIV